MKNELLDFPLESQRAYCNTRVSVNERLTIVQEHLKGDDVDCMIVQLTQAQVIEIINLCRGRLIGNLTGLPLAFIAQHDQAMTYLRECMPSLDDIHRDGESMVIQMLDSHPAESIQMIHTMALITRLLLADQATSPAPPKS